MKAIVMDSGLGGKDFINKLKKNTKIKYEFVKLFNKMVSTYNKKYIKKNLLKIINNYVLYNNIFIILACHSASSCILDILIKNNFIINNIRIYEPIIPMCFYIKENKYKNILILSTPITEKIRWHFRLLKFDCKNIKYLTFNLLAKQIEDHNNFEKSLDRLKLQSEFIKICDCVILGCTHYNIIKDEILNELKNKYNFKGVILDSNNILLNYFINDVKKFI
jgi:glutamate racemase